jgi:hypothetical protein
MSSPSVTFQDARRADLVGSAVVDDCLLGARPHDHPGAPARRDRTAVCTVGISRRLTMTEIGSLGEQIPAVEKWLDNRDLVSADLWASRLAD